MLKIIAGDLHIEVTTGTPYEVGTVPKYYLKFSDESVAAVYKPGIIKSVSDRHSETIRTLGGSLVALEPDVLTGGYITCTPTQQQLKRFQQALFNLEALRDFVLTGKNLTLVRHEKLDYEMEVPTDEDLLVFFRKIKSLSELEIIAQQLNNLLGPMDIVHPDIGDRDYLAFSFSQGCDGGCVKCNFQHNRRLIPRSQKELHNQIEFYKNIFSPDERARFEIFAGNHRGLGIDFELFAKHIGRIRNDAGMGGGRVFAFCNAEDILRLHEQYGAKDFEAQMLTMDLHLNLGVESGSLSGLREYGKNTDLAAIRKALTILKNTKISYSVNILAGVEWENHVLETVKLFRGLYRPADNKPAVYSSEFINELGNVDRQLETEQNAIFRKSLNECGIHIFRYTFVPFNTINHTLREVTC